MCPQDACSRDGSTFAVWTRWAEDSAEGKRHQKSTCTDVYWLVLMGPRKGYIIYIHHLFLSLSLSVSPYICIHIYIYLVLVCFNTSKIGICHPNSEYLTLRQILWIFNWCISIYPLKTRLTDADDDDTLLGIPRTTWVIPNWTAGSWRRSLLFVGNHYVHCVFRFHLLIFQGSTLCT